jgi:hypothetical protein
MICQTADRGCPGRGIVGFRSGAYAPCREPESRGNKSMALGHSMDQQKKNKDSERATQPAEHMPVVNLIAKTRFLSVFNIRRWMPTPLKRNIRAKPQRAGRPVAAEGGADGTTTDLARTLATGLGDETSITAGSKPRARRPTASASASIALCWRSSTGRAFRKRIIRRSTSYRPIWMPGSAHTTRIGRIRAAGATWQMRNF